MQESVASLFGFFRGFEIATDDVPCSYKNLLQPEFLWERVQPQLDRGVGEVFLFRAESFHPKSEEEACWVVEVRTPLEDSIYVLQVM